VGEPFIRFLYLTDGWIHEGTLDDTITLSVSDRVAINKLLYTEGRRNTPQVKDDYKIIADIVKPYTEFTDDVGVIVVEEFGTRCYLLKRALRAVGLPIIHRYDVALIRKEADIRNLPRVTLKCKQDLIWLLEEMGYIPHHPNSIRKKLFKWFIRLKRRINA
jgi:hypothetical protein